MMNSMIDMPTETYRVTDFDRKTIECLFSQSGGFLSVWSLSEIKLLAEISPLTVKRINECTGSNYEFTAANLEEQAKSLAAFLTLSMDNSVFKGVMKPNLTRSKLRNLKKLYDALGEDCPISHEEITEGNCLDFAYSIKQLALSAIKKYQRTFAETQRLSCQNGLSCAGFFAELFGDNLERIVQYGSSVNGGGKDIDLMILLNQITRKTYDAINGKQDKVPSEKPVGIVLLPSDGLTAYADCDYHSLTIAREGKLVYGKDLDFPVLSEEESIRKMYFKAGKELTSLRGALGDPNRQEDLAKSSEFLRATLKLEIWIRKALLQKQLGRYLSKEEFLELEPVHIADLGDSPSLNEVRTALYDANCRVKDRIERYLSC